MINLLALSEYILALFEDNTDLFYCEGQHNGAVIVLLTLIHS